MGPVEYGSFNMNKLNVLALFAGLFFCDVSSRSDINRSRGYINTKCVQLITCNGVCSIEPPGIVSADGTTDEWEVDATGVCDETRGCVCWKPSIDNGDGCTPTDGSDTRICAKGGPPSISSFYQCPDDPCFEDANDPTQNCYPWVRKPCDVSICDSYKCVKRYKTCTDKKGICAHEAPIDGWIEDGICHKYNDCKCWVKDE